MSRPTSERVTAARSPEAPVPTTTQSCMLDILV